LVASVTVCAAVWVVCATVVAAGCIAGGSVATACSTTGGSGGAEGVAAFPPGC
jgi:hypothetical protein